MIRILLVSLLIMSACSASAQNWQTVRPGDTAYFTAGKHYSYKSWVYYPKQDPPMMDSPVLRMAYVTAVSAIGPDTTFAFFTGLRDSSVNAAPGPCVDTAGPSWLGRMCIRKPNGTEYYFNSRNDTIEIRTHAGLGDSWLLALDTAGLRFIGTISQLGIINIDSTLDSFKTISIQAYSGINPVSHPYNAKELKLSKEHGWIKTLDFYRFPNTLWVGGRKGIVLDSTQQLRLPAAFSEGRMIQRIDWKYGPGNEWIWKLEDKFGFNPDNTPRFTTVRHDSVLSFQLLSPGVGLATIRSIELKSSHVYNGPAQLYNDASSVTVKIHSDTVRDIAGNPVPVKVENDWRHNSHNRYFAWPYDSVRCFTTRADLAHFATQPVYSNGCMRFLPFSAVGDWDHFETYLADFGQTGKYELSLNSWDGSIVTAQYGRYIYIRTGSSVFGTKVNVSTLAAESPAMISAVSIRPNPADDHVLVNSTLPPQRLQLALHSVSGQVVWQAVSFEQQLRIPTSNLPAGLYFLDVSGPGVRQTIKVVVQH